MMDTVPFTLTSSSGALSAAVCEIIIRRRQGVWLLAEVRLLRGRQSIHLRHALSFVWSTLHTDRPVPIIPWYCPAICCSPLRRCLLTFSQRHLMNFNLFLVILWQVVKWRCSLNSFACPSPLFLLLIHLLLRRGSNDTAAKPLMSHIHNN